VGLRNTKAGLNSDPGSLPTACALTSTSLLVQINLFPLVRVPQFGVAPIFVPVVGEDPSHGHLSLGLRIAGPDSEGGR
jgi:hypothetical protein